jgi:hypothetical protein
MDPWTQQQAYTLCLTAISLRKHINDLIFNPEKIGNQGRSDPHPIAFLAPESCPGILIHSHIDFVAPGQGM